MKKYLAIIKIEISRQFMYRTNITAFVVGNILELLAQVVIWTAIYNTVDIIKGYNYEEMMTYVVFGWFFMFITANYGFENIISRDIQSGTLSNFITKPMSYTRYIVAKSCGRIVIASIVVVLQATLLFVLFRDYIIFDFTLLEFFVLIIMLIFAYLIKLFFAILIGFAAFWVVDVSGVYMAAGVFMKFLSGAYFPINLLPIFLLNISLAFPFAYTYFFPVLFYLGKFSLEQAFVGIGIQIVWLFMLYYLIKFVWNKGTKNYESVGI